MYINVFSFFLLLQFKKKIRGEQQRRKEVEEDIKALKQELENKINQVPILKDLFYFPIFVIMNHFMY